MKPVPQSLYDRAELLARVHDLKTVAEIIGKSLPFVCKMRKRGWKTQAYPLRPRPSDFAIQAKHLNVKELERHYRAGSAVVRRWREELRG